MFSLFKNPHLGIAKESPMPTPTPMATANRAKNMFENFLVTLLAATLMESCDGLMADARESVEDVGETPTSDRLTSTGRLHISVMSYNVFFHPRQGQDREARRQHLVEALAGVGDEFRVRTPDVIAFQEVDDDFAEDEGLRRLYPHRTSKVLMNMIASKHPIVVFQHLQSQPGNMYAKLDFSAGGENKFVHLLNVHLFPGDFNTGHEKRMEEYEELQQWIQTLDIPKTEPVIIAGDFNDETDDAKDMRHWVLNYDHNKTGSFQDGVYFPGSWTSRANWLVALHLKSRYSYYPRDYTKTIDYVVYDKRFLAPSSAEEMKVILLKAKEPWVYRCEGPSPWCSKEVMQHLKGFWEASTWYEGGKLKRLFSGSLEKPDDLYDELSDHFPVIQEYTFQY